MLRNTIVIIVLMFVSSHAQFVKPQMKFIVDTYDFGKIKQNDVVEHTFEFYNDGGDTLKIFDVSASCGCSVGRLDKKEYGPGEKGTINVRFDSRGKFGNQIQRIYIRTNEPDNPTKIITVKAQVYIDTTDAPRVFFEKLFHNFGDIEEGKIYETRFSFKNVGKNVLEIVDLHSSCGCTAVIPKKRKLKEGESSEIRVEFNSTNFNGLITKYIVVRTNDPEHSEIYLTIQGNVIKN